MENLFSAVLSMSKTATIVILVVLAVSRIILENAPKKFSYALWTVVLFRLLCPFTFESPLSPLPSVQVMLTSKDRTSPRRKAPRTRCSPPVCPCLRLNSPLNP